MRKKYLLLTALLCLSAMTFAGCGQKDNADNAASASPGVSDDNIMDDIEDGVDDAVNDAEDMLNDATGGDDDGTSDTGIDDTNNN